MAKGRVGLGRRGEELTARALAHQGYQVVKRNWRCHCGEADLIARRGADWYFVEVRTRRGAVHAVPEQSATRSKIARMERVARTYLGLHVSALNAIWHLSFAAVEMDRTGKLQRITFYEDLFGPPLALFEARPTSEAQSS